MRAAPIDGGGWTFRAREYTGNRGARLEQRQQYVGASRIADSRRGGREPNALHRRHVGKLRGSKRRDGRRHDVLYRGRKRPRAATDIANSIDRFTPSRPRYAGAVAGEVEASDRLWRLAA